MVIFGTFYVNMLISGRLYDSFDEELGSALITSNVVALGWGAFSVFCMQPHVRDAVHNFTMPYYEAIERAAAELDEDGDGDVSMLELFTSGSAARKKAMQVFNCVRSGVKSG